MSEYTSRRNFLTTAVAATLLGACGSKSGSARNGVAELDARVDASRSYLLKNYPSTKRLEKEAAGVLYMPRITKVGLFYGGSYGRGALRIKNVSVDYYSVTGASFGLQIGAQEYAHALFFMTTEALTAFRRSSGWVAGAGVTYATPSEGGGTFGADTIQNNPVVAFIYGQKGLAVGATLSGSKYSRIVP